MKNEIAAPFGLAMTPCDVKIFNAFVLDAKKAFALLNALSMICCTNANTNE